MAPSTWSVHACARWSTSYRPYEASYPPCAYWTGPASPPPGAIHHLHGCVPVAGEHQQARAVGTVHLSVWPGFFEPCEPPRADKPFALVLSGCRALAGSEIGARGDRQGDADKNDDESQRLLITQLLCTDGTYGRSRVLIARRSSMGSFGRLLQRQLQVEHLARLRVPFCTSSMSLGR